MSAAPKTYEIRTVDDFFKVPPDRRDVCLKEFAAWMAVSDFMIALVEETGTRLERPDLFEWIDDEKGEVSISIDNGREKTTIFRGHVK